MIPLAHSSRKTILVFLFLMITSCSLDLLSVPFLFSLDQPIEVYLEVYFFSLAFSLKLIPFVMRHLSLKRSFLGALALMAFASTGCSLAPSFSVFFPLGRFLQGMGAACLIMTGQQLFRFFSPESSRRALSRLFFIAGTALFILIPLTTAFLSSFFCRQSLFYFQALFSLGTLTFFYINLPSSSSFSCPSLSPSSYFHPSFLPLFFSYAFLTYIFWSGAKNAPSHFGLIATLSALSVVLLSPLLFSFVDRYAPSTLLLVGIFALCISCLCLRLCLPFTLIFLAIPLIEMGSMKRILSSFPYASWDKRALEISYFRYLGMAVGIFFTKGNLLWLGVSVALSILFYVVPLLRKKGGEKRLSRLPLS